MVGGVGWSRLQAGCLPYCLYIVMRAGRLRMLDSSFSLDSVLYEDAGGRGILADSNEFSRGRVSGSAGQRGEFL